MSVTGFVVVAFMLTAYVLLDGYDLGVAAISLFVARSERERGTVLASIGPFWNGNEVWLIAAGGALFALFPKAYASAFSGFYLPFIIVLWLLMFRGIALELREHYEGELWHQFWDAAFWLSSALLIVLFGIALGNLLRGVPLDEHGYFQGTFGLLLNPYALGVGLFSLAALAQHGAAFLALRVTGGVERRSVAAMRGLWWATLVLYVGVSAATLGVRGLPASPWLVAMPLLSLAALLALRLFLQRERFAAVFAASALFLATLLAGAAGSLFPYLIPAYPLGHGGLSIFDSAPSPVALACALTVTIGGTAVVLIYGAIVTRTVSGGKVPVE